MRLEWAHAVVVQTVPHHDPIGVRPRDGDFADGTGLDVIWVPDAKVDLLDLTNGARHGDKSVRLVVPYIHL